MAQKEEKVTDIRETLLATVYLQEALINLLDRKGILKKEEILKELEEVKKTVVKSGIIN
jgi:hypothetical protein